MTEPSKVLHVRNVGPEIAENDLLQLVQPFGIVVKLVMLRTKNQALLQLQDVSSSVKCMQYYSTIQPSVRGRNVYIQFSSHQELKTTEQQGQPRHSNLDQEMQPNRILLITIQHPLYPVTVDALNQVFSPYGFVEKIIMFQKSAGPQALVQFTSQHSAQRAKNDLQGRNIYDGCCTLEIQFSNLQELQVNYNNERTRDFTNPSLPSEQTNRNPRNHSLDNVMPIYGDNIYGMQANGSRPVPYQQLLGAPHGMGLNSYQMTMGSVSTATSAFGGSLPQGITGTNERSTLIVSNLDPEQMDAEKIFHLFSNYGNIIRIKLLHNKPDHALVQMGDGFQAELAVTYLKGINLFGKRMEVNYSKYSQINQSPDVHDYSQSKLNRFIRNVEKNYRHCCAPTKMIHVSSIPMNVVESDLVQHLEEHGNILHTKIFEHNGKKQALVEFENEEQATEALVCKHASSLNGSTIRLAFSKVASI